MTNFYEKIMGVTSTSALRPAFVIFGLCAIAFSFSACSSSTSSHTEALKNATQACGSSAPKLTLHATGTGSGAPNELLMSLGVSTTAATANGALTLNNQKANAVITVLKAGHVPQKTIQTTGLSIQPQFSKVNTITQITSYNVTNTVEVTIKETKSAGTLIDEVTKAGGNTVRIGGLNFAQSNPTALQDAARMNAVKAGVAHASSMAAAAGEHLGPLCSVEDTPTTSSTTSDNHDEGFSNALTATASLPATIERGTTKTSATVELVYSIQP